VLPLKRKSQLIWATTLASLACSVQAQIRTNTNAGLDPVCGFTAGPHVYSQSAQVTQGLAVDLIVGDAQVGQPVRFRFFVNQRPRGTPVDNLQVEHEKLMHVIGLREDLNEFFHIHPSKVSPGMWEVEHTFSRGGIYKLWADLKEKGVSYSFGLPLVRVSKPTDTAHDSASGGCVTNCSYQIQFRENPALVVGRTNRLEFFLCDPLGNSTAAENFLGASMHLVIIKADLSEFLHAHPENHIAGESLIRFNQLFAKPGKYKLFAQARPKLAKLPLDEAVLAEFWVTVRE